MISIHHDKCDLCGTCVGICPADCITMSEKLLSIDSEICIDCDLCVEICPVYALESDDEK